MNSRTMKAFAGVAAVLGATVLFGVALMNKNAKRDVQTGAEVFGCLVRTDDGDSTNLRYGKSGFFGSISYDFNFGAAILGGSGPVSFRDISNGLAQFAVLEAYDATKRAGFKCPAPQFAP